jgi:hypothetical protein
MIYGDKFLAPEDFPLADSVNGGPAREARSALRRVKRDILITDWHYRAPYGGTTRYFKREGFEVQMVTATNLFWHDSIPLRRGHHWIVETIDRAVAKGATGVFNSNWEYYNGQFFDNFWYFQGLAAERAWTAAPHDYLTWGRRFAARFWGVTEDYYAEIGGLAETVVTRRRRVFSEGQVLDVDNLGAREYPELGDYLIAQARRFQRAARRNADTLRLMDMPGQMIRYVGIRSRQRVLLERALRAGSRTGALAALAAIKQAADQVARRLAVGYRLYGGAVVDLKRLAWHRRALIKASRILQRIPAKRLPALPIERLLAKLNEPAPSALRNKLNKK